MSREKTRLLLDPIRPPTADEMAELAGRRGDLIGKRFVQNLDPAEEAELERIESYLDLVEMDETDALLKTLAKKLGRQPIGDAWELRDLPPRPRRRASAPKIGAARRTGRNHGA